MNAFLKIIGTHCSLPPWLFFNWFFHLHLVLFVDNHSGLCPSSPFTHCLSFHAPHPPPTRFPALLPAEPGWVHAGLSVCCCPVLCQWGFCKSGFLYKLKKKKNKLKMCRIGTRCFYLLSFVTLVWILCWPYFFRAYLLTFASCSFTALLWFGGFL